MRRLRVPSPLLIPAAYALFGALWIVLSDRLLPWLTSDPSAAARFGMAKGLLFVGVTSLLLAGLLRVGARRRTRADRLVTETHAALQASERKFRELVELLPQSVFECDLQGTLTFGNRQASDLVGYTPDEFRAGLGLRQLVVPTERDRLEHHIQRLLQSEGAPGHEYTLQRKDGTTVAVAVYAGRIVRNGVPVGLRGILVDITARQAAEAALAASAEQHRTILQTAMDGFFAGDAQGRLLDVNEACCRLYGYSRAELLALPLVALEAVESPEAISEHMRRIIAAGSDRFETRHRRKDGSVCEVEVSVTYVPAQGGRFCCFVRDITARKQAEAALAARTRQLEVVRAVAGELTRELDLPTVLRLITQHACELTGASGGVLYLWEPSTETLRPEAAHGQAVSRQQIPRRLGEGVLGIVAQRREGVLLNAYRTSPWAHPHTLAHSTITAVLVEPLLHGDRLLGVLGLAHAREGGAFTTQDQATLQLFAAQAVIALENARLFAELNDSYTQLQGAQAEMVRTEKLRALGQMAAGIAHDLNNMLAAVLGQAELLRLRVHLPEVEADLQILHTAASDGAQVVRRLLEFGRPHPTRPPVPCDLATLVAEALELTRPHWQDEAQRQNRHIQVWTALDGLPRVAGDPAELREALANLILNAADAMPTGGTLTIAGYPGPFPAPSGEPGTVVLTLTDTGTGMSAEVQRHIFEPFFTTKGTQGSGLGLALVYGILERHRGRIEVTSSPGQGTTFTLHLPVTPAGQVASPAGAPAPARARVRLLVVDDEDPVRITLARLLQSLGHQVVEAGSGAEALAHLATTPVDLVITDLGMPEMTGWDVAQRVKAAHPHLPVILLTGWGQQLPGASPGQACVDRVLSKPTRLEDLQDAIARCVNGQTKPHAGPRE